MAALMSMRLWTASFTRNYSIICAGLNNIGIQDSLSSSCSLVNEVQKRHMSRVKRRTTHAPRHWAVRRIKFMEENLTNQNKQFLGEFIKEKYSGYDSPLKDSPWARGEWNPKSRRTGLIARKIGIYPMWMTDGTRVLATLLQVVDNHVVRYSPPEVFALTKYGFGSRGKKKYGALVVGAETGDPQKFTAAYNNLFKVSGLCPKRRLSRFYITPDAAIQPGTPLSINHFRVGDYVDVYGKTIGHGFQGVVKRWGMKGGPASHGTTKAHRRVGSIGTGRTMSRVWPGKKMPGHMGQERRTLCGLKVLRINTTHNCMWVLGPAVPGHVHSYVYIMDCRLPTRKFSPESPPPFPTFYAGEQDPLPEDSFAPGVHQFSAPSITYENEPEIAIPTQGAKKMAKR